MHFSWIFFGTFGFYGKRKENLTKKTHATFLYVYEWNGKSFKECLKKRITLSFITKFNIEFLLLFNSCRKVLGKMPAKLTINNKIPIILILGRVT